MPVRGPHFANDPQNSNPKEMNVSGYSSPGNVAVEKEKCFAQQRFQLHYNRITSGGTKAWSVNLSQEILLIMQKHSLDHLNHFHIW